MLPRTMSQGNDAFSSKDADRNTDELKAATVAEGNGSASETSDGEAPIADTAKGAGASEPQSAAAKPAKAGDADPDDESTDASQDDGDAERKDAPSKSPSAREKEPTRNRRKGGSRRSSRDEDENEPEPPQTEEAINVPKMETIYMLGAMSVLTIILWFAAKLSCNIHPDQMRDPKHFSTRDLAADPKNAAFEFHHKFETGDYVTALDLATGDAKNVVEAKLKACEQDPDPCLKAMTALAGTVQSTGKVLDRHGDRATVELTSESKSWPGRKTFSFDVVKEGDFWRVASRKEIATSAAAAHGTPAQAATGAVEEAAAASAEPAQPTQAPAQPASETP